MERKKLLVRSRLDLRGLPAARRAVHVVQVAIRVALRSRAAAARRAGASACGRRCSSARHSTRAGAKTHRAGAPPRGKAHQQATPHSARPCWSLLSCPSPSLGLGSRLHFWALYCCARGPLSAGRHFAVTPALHHLSAFRGLVRPSLALSTRPLPPRSRAPPDRQNL